MGPTAFWVFFFSFLWEWKGLRLVIVELPFFSLSMAICMWAHMPVVPVDTVDFIKFLTPQGYKSGYYCKCFKLLKLSQCSMLTPRLCASHAQRTLNHTSLTTFSFILFSHFIFASYNTCHFHRLIKRRLYKLTPRGFGCIVLWNFFAVGFIDSPSSFLFSLRTT